LCRRLAQRLVITGHVKLTGRRIDGVEGRGRPRGRLPRVSHRLRLSLTPATTVPFRLGVTRNIELAGRGIDGIERRTREAAVRSGSRVRLEPSLAALFGW